MGDKAERVGRNEALFRQVNERLEELGSSFSLVTDSAEFVCECGDLTCAGHIRMSLSDYERIRGDGTWFAVLDGHEIPDVESIVERHDGWNIIAKHPGRPAELASEEDPRG